jgi:hypothetical protein
MDELDKRLLHLRSSWKYGILNTSGWNATTVIPCACGLFLYTLKNTNMFLYHYSWSPLKSSPCLHYRCLLRLLTLLTHLCLRIATKGTASSCSLCKKKKDSILSCSDGHLLFLCSAAWEKSTHPSARKRLFEGTDGTDQVLVTPVPSMHTASYLCLLSLLVATANDSKFRKNNLLQRCWTALV